MNFWISKWISGFQIRFLVFTVDFWISVWISADSVQISFVTDPLATVNYVRPKGYNMQKCLVIT